MNSGTGDGGARGPERYRARAAADSAGAAVPDDGPLRVVVRDDAALDTLANQERLYAVVDTAGDLAAYEHLLTLGDRARCLYYGTDGARYAGIAPWLVHVDGAVYQWIDDALDARTPHWGVFVVSTAPATTVARQLRRWLTVRDPDGELVRFRFYDPRVLVPFLEESTGPELHAFYGSAIDAFAAYTGPAREPCFYARRDAWVALPPLRRVLVSAPSGEPRRPPPEGGAPFPLGLPARQP